MRKYNGSQIDVQHEIAAMVSFLATRWSGIPEPAALLKDIQDHAWHAFRGVIDRHALDEEVFARADKREALLDAHSDPGVRRHGRSFDHPSIIWGALPFVASKFAAAGQCIDGRWDFERRSNQLGNAMLAKYPGLEKARPIGWEEMRANYTEFDGQQEYCNGQHKIDRTEFEGTECDFSQAPQFPSAVALPYVMYGDVAQNQRPWRSLVGSAFSCFLSLRAMQNTRDVAREIMDLPWQDDSPSPVFRLKLAPQGQLAKALLTLCTEYLQESKQLDDLEPEFHRACEHDRRFDALGDDEKAAQIAQNAAYIDQVMEQLRRESRPLDVAKEDERFNARVHALLGAGDMKPRAVSKPGR